MREAVILHVYHLMLCIEASASSWGLTSWWLELLTSFGFSVREELRCLWPVCLWVPLPGRDDTISPSWCGTVRTGTQDNEVLKYEGKRISESWCYPSDKAVPLNRAKKITEWFSGESDPKYLLNVWELAAWQIPANSHLGFEEKKYDNCLQCLESNLYFLLSFSLTSSAALIWGGLQAALGFQEGKSIGETDGVSGHTEKDRHSRSRAISPESEAFQLSLKGLNLKITLWEKKPQRCLLRGETRVIRGHYSHHCNIALPCSAS